MYTDNFGGLRDEHERIQLQDGDDLPRAIVALQVWSDGLAATNFGSGYLWPIYMQFGNQCKYERRKASREHIHTIAHVPQVSDDDPIRQLSNSV